MTAWDNIKPFVFGGISGMAATTIIQPIDMIKVRVQLAGEQGIKGNAITLATKIIREQGFLSLYTGLSAGLLRQATYTTARMGLFNTFNKQWQVYNADPNPKAPATLFQKSISGLAAGGLGAFIGNPCDLVLIRMQSDGLQAPDKRQHYRGVGDAMTRIVRAEGVLALWKGATPTIVRAMSLNLGMLTTHAEAKLYFDREIGKGWISDFCSSAVAGFFASALSLPFDFVKTRLQKQTPDANGKLRYNGVLDCAQKVLRTEGPLAFYKGFPTYYLRIAPHAMITLLTATALNTFFAAEIKGKKIM